MSCESQLKFFSTALSNHESWAVRLFDNWAKIQSGLLQGNSRNDGLYPECLSFRHQSSLPGVGLIRGQHCTVSFRSLSEPVNPNLGWSDIGKIVRDNNLRLESGICVPATCTHGEVLNYANEILASADLRATGANCHVDDGSSLGALDLFAISVFSMLMLLIIASTIFELVMKDKPYGSKKVLTSFSLYTNVKEMLKIEPKSSRSIECFYGLRALSAFWVIAGHRVFRHDRMVSRPMKIENLFAQLIIAIFMTNGYAVDVFFLLSGILVAQSVLRLLDKKKLNPAKIYFNRYMRYIPTVAVLLLFFVSSLQFLLVDGPSISFLQRQVQSCERYWWSSLLLIQNYVNVNNICMGSTWYLSADFQLYLLSPIFVFLLWKFGYKIFWLFGVIIVATQISIFFARYNDTISEHIIYRQTHFRIAQFLVGIAVGYIMYMREGKNHMRKRSKFLLWVLTLTIFLAIEVYHETHKGNRFAEAFYTAVHRIAWASLIGWIVYASHHLKSGGVINWFLSLPFWQPIARISLSIYLIHDIYIVLSVVNMKELWYFDSSWLIHIILGDILMSSLLGAVLYLFIEAPSTMMLKYLMK